MPEATYDRPVKAKLVVRLDNGEEHDATPEDLVKFKLVDRLDAYMSVQRKLTEILESAGLLDYDNPVAGEYRELVDSELNPLRHLIEVALSMPELLDHPDYEGWENVIDLERRLRAVKPVGDTGGQPNEAYDGKPLAEIIRDFAVTRGDLSEEYARGQMKQAVLRSAEVNALVSRAQDRVRAASGGVR